MAAEYIPITTSDKRLAQELRSLVNSLATSKSQATRLKAIMEKNIDGSNYGALETQFGIGTGSGVTVYNLLAGIIDDLATADVSNFLDRLG